MGASSSSCFDSETTNTGPTVPIKTDDQVQRAVLTVFFEGTANHIDYNVTLIGLFASLAEGKDIRLYPSYDDPNHQYKMCFDGCGVTNGNMGVIFATGLAEQCNKVLAHINDILSTSTYDAVTVNAVGLSRGGIAVMYLAQLLSNHSRDIVITNLLLFDPVPGNLITSSRFLDWIGFSTANSSMDLTYCRNIGVVLALYPVIPLPDMAFHAPILPLYPDCATVTEDAVLGCHQGAVFCQKSRECVLSFVRMKQWLISCGTRLSRTTASDSLDLSLSSCKHEMDYELAADSPESTRYTHSSPSGALILRYKNGPIYLNKWHEALTIELSNSLVRAASKVSDSEESRKVSYLLEIRQEL